MLSWTRKGAWCPNWLSCQRSPRTVLLRRQAQPPLQAPPPRLLHCKRLFPTQPQGTTSQLQGPFGGRQSLHAHRERTRGEQTPPPPAVQTPAASLTPSSAGAPGTEPAPPHTARQSPPSWRRQAYTCAGASLLGSPTAVGLQQRIPGELPLSAHWRLPGSQHRQSFCFSWSPVNARSSFPGEAPAPGPHLVHPRPAANSLPRPPASPPSHWRPQARAGPGAGPESSHTLTLAFGGGREGEATSRAQQTLLIMG